MPKPIWITISGMAIGPLSSEMIGASTAASATRTRVETEAEAITLPRPEAAGWAWTSP